MNKERSWLMRFLERLRFLAPQPLADLHALYQGYVGGQMYPQHRIRAIGQSVVHGRWQSNGLSP